MGRCSARELLEKVPDHGYPDVYLLSRIRGKKSRLIRDWSPFISSPSPHEQLPEGHYQGISEDRSPEGIWRKLFKEYRWVYHQMNEQLRKTFSPFFLHAELRTLFICLRNLKGMKTSMVKETLAASLFSNEMKHILMASTDEGSAVHLIEEQFLCMSERFRGISEIMHQKGLKGFERAVTERFLSIQAGAKLNPLLRNFFVHLIDARNMLALAKLLKLETKEESPFLPGGTVDAERLTRIFETKELPAAEKVLWEATGQSGSLDPLSVEASLYRKIGRSLKNAGRMPLGIGPILNYLWRCSIEAMNLSVLSYGQELKRDIVTAELIR